MTTFPLTTFEEYLFWEDRPAYPWSCFIRLRFRGQLRRAEFQAAIARVLTRHPLMHSKIERRGTKWVWVPSDDAPQACWIEQDQPIGREFPTATHLDLRSEIGLRVHVTVDARDSDVVLQFHHACCDGAGIMTFVNDILLAYVLERDGLASVEMPPIDLATLPARGRYRLTWGELLRLLPRQIIGLQGVRQFLQRSPVPLTPHNVCPNEDPPPPRYPTAFGHLFTVEESLRLRQAAQRQGVTTNDILARDLFLAMITWQREYGCCDDRHWLRMMIPMNMRAKTDREMSAANVVSSVFLDRHGLQTANSAELLEGIHDEMQLIKTNQLGLIFWYSLGLFRWLPGGLHKTARADKCTVSCILTNLGELRLRSNLPRQNGRLVLGDLTLETFQILAPIRPYNCVSFAAFRYARRLAIDLHFDPRVLNADQASRLLDLFVERVTTSMMDAGRD